MVDPNLKTRNTDFYMSVTGCEDESSRGMQRHGGLDARVVVRYLLMAVQLVMGS